MSRLTGTLGHALLGVLAEGPRTGYALVRHLAQSIAYTWPASHSQVYPALARLREAGLIRERAAAPRGGRVYELTDAGLEEVRRWLRETEPSRTVRGEAERARATLAEFQRIAAQEIRTRQRPGRTAPHSTSACARPAPGSPGPR